MNGASGVAPGPWRGRVLVAVGLAALGLALAFPRLGVSALWDPWEPKYAQTALEMVDRGDLVVPYYRSEPRLLKPPVTYWLIAGAQESFGATEGAARLPSALLAVLVPLALGLALAGLGRPLEGFLAGAALITGSQWLLLGRSATPDIPLAAWLGLLLALAIGCPSPRGRGRGAALLLAAAGLVAAAAMTDWPRGLVLPAWAVLGWRALGGRPRDVLPLVVTATIYAVGQHLQSGPLGVASFALAGLLALWTLHRQVPHRGAVPGAVLIAVALTLPWLVAIVRLEPAEAAEGLLGYKHAINLGEGLGEKTGPPWFPLVVVAAGALPWIAAVPSGLRRAWGDGADRPARILAGTVLGGLLFFALSEAKMGHFYGVLQPAFAGLAGLGAAALIRRPDRHGLAAAVGFVAVAALVLVRPAWILEGVNVFSEPAGVATGKIAVAAGLAAAVMFALGCLRRRPGWAVAAVLPVAVASLHLVQQTVPALDDTRSTRSMVSRYLRDHRPGEPLGTFGWTKESVFYYRYRRGEVPRIRHEADLAAFLAGPGDRYLIAPRDEADTLRFAGPPRARWEMLETGHPYLLLLRYRPHAGSAETTESGKE